MKKNLVRIVALLLVAMLALTLIPIGTLAATVNVFEEYHEEKDPEWGDDHDTYYIGTEVGKNVTIKTSDYDKHIVYDGDLYDLKGIFDWSDWDKDKKIDMSSSLSFSGKRHYFVGLGYVPHSHKLSYWYSDSTTHWRECLVCKHYSQFDEDFMYQNWHSDGDEDRICDVCNADIPYHKITVIESEGGNITVNEAEAPHRRKIVANVEAAEGYKLKKLHFTKIRDDGTTQEITRKKNADGFWTYMPTYDLEVSAEFVKK